MIDFNICAVILNPIIHSEVSLDKHDLFQV